MDEAASSFVDFPDAAVIPSLIAQAFQQVPVGRAVGWGVGVGAPG
jgi:hypothetical protein